VSAAGETEAEPEAGAVPEDEIAAEGESQLNEWMYEAGGEVETERPLEAAAELEGPEEPPLEIPAAEHEQIPAEEAVTADTPVDRGQMALIQARNAVAQSSPEEAFVHYSGLVKSRALLPEVIQDLHEALSRFPENVPLMQTLGDAFARSDQLQEALDTYTKAEELLLR
jgi:hypothetical protein